MRYRPLAHQSMAVSAISVRLDDRFQRSGAEWAALVLAAMECGVNCFEVTGRSPALVDGMSQALRAVERRLIHIAWRFGPKAMPPAHAAAGFSASGMQGLAKAVIARTGLGYLDLVQLDDPGQHDLPPEGLQALKQMRAQGQVRAIGIAGQGEEIEAYISTGAFNALTMPFNMLSGSRERRRMKAASERSMSVLGYGAYPQAALAVMGCETPKKGLLGWGRKADKNTAEPYSFLHQTADWTAEQICLAYALTEPTLASVQIEPQDVAHLQALAVVAERELPSGMPAQIEMSRFTALNKDANRA